MLFMELFYFLNCVWQFSHDAESKFVFKIVVDFNDVSYLKLDNLLRSAMKSKFVITFNLVKQLAFRIIDSDSFEVYPVNITVIEKYFRYYEEKDFICVEFLTRKMLCLFK